MGRTEASAEGESRRQQQLPIPYGYRVSALLYPLCGITQIVAKPGENLERKASALGYRRVLLQTIAHRNGRPVFEVFRYTAGPSVAPSVAARN